jgi:hypothetical protein
MLQRSKIPLPGLSCFGSAEDRKEERRRVLWQGKILLGRAVIWCAVRDVSASGARLEVGEDVRLPGEFDLVLGHREEIMGARLRWREGRFAGVSLTRL